MRLVFAGTPEAAVPALEALEDRLAPAIVQSKSGDISRKTI